MGSPVRSLVKRREKLLARYQFKAASSASGLQGPEDRVPFPLLRASRFVDTLQSDALSARKVLVDSACWKNQRMNSFLLVCRSDQLALLQMPLDEEQKWG